MSMLDLEQGEMIDPILPSMQLVPEDQTLGQSIGAHLETDFATETAIGISFPKFSDGRGFTVARRLRTEVNYTGPIIALGHVTPDQADFLRRCGFTHVSIDDAKLGQWQFSLSIIKSHFQSMPGSRRSRDTLS